MKDNSKHMEDFKFALQKEVEGLKLKGVSFDVREILIWPKRAKEKAANQS